jgi:hypothetical protein
MINNPRARTIRNTTMPQIEAYANLPRRLVGAGILQTPFHRVRYILRENNLGPYRIQPMLLLRFFW